MGSNNIPKLVAGMTRVEDGEPWTFADLVRAMGGRPYDRKVVYNKLKDPETGLGGMTWDTIKQLAGIFGVSPYALESDNPQDIPVYIPGESDRALLAQALHSYLLRFEGSERQIASLAARLGIGSELMAESKAFKAHVQNLQEAEA